MKVGRFHKDCITREYTKVIETEGLPNDRIAVVDKDGEELCSIFGPGIVKIIFTPRFKGNDYIEDM